MSKNKILLLILTIVLLQPTKMQDVSASSKNQYVYTTTNVNVRKYCSIRSKKITCIKKGTKILRIKKLKNGWSKVKICGKCVYIKSQYLSSKKIKNRWSINLSKAEKNFLYEICYFESRGDSSRGQQAVAECILNRIKSNKFPNSLYGVISQKGQFASFKLLGVSKYLPEYKQVVKNCKKVLEGKTNILPYNYVFFSTHGHSRHAGFKVIGSHQFCPTW